MVKVNSSQDSTQVLPAFSGISESEKIFSSNEKVENQKTKEIANALLPLDFQPNISKKSIQESPIFETAEILTDDSKEKSKSKDNELSPKINTALKTEKVRQKTLSLEEGDQPILHDTLFNYIPGSCFEAGSSLALLEQPGAAGQIIDDHAQQLSQVMDTVYHSDQGNTEIVHLNKTKTLKSLFDEKILKELTPASDQIGRCTNNELKDEWLNGTGEKWVREQLETPTDDEKDNQSHMLTKIRSLSGFGTIIRELNLDNNEQNLTAMAACLNQSPETVLSRSREIKTIIRHSGFDNPTTRARVERAPIVDGKSIAQRDDGQARELKEASEHGLGFGKVYVDPSFTDTQQEIELKQKYNQILTEKGRGGIPRQGQAIQDSSRPGALSEFGYNAMPKSFKEAGLEDKLNAKKLDHGSGINRWSLKGTYPRESWNNDLPAAGAHSGGTSDIFLALNCLNENSIAGNKDIVLPAGLMISSFMNFGGYHTFVETFPIAQAFATGTTFQVEVNSAQQKGLYNDFIEAANRYGGENAQQQIHDYKAALDQSIPQ